jgi:hypothetical protein
MNLSAEGEAITQTSQPAAWASSTNGERSPAGRPPQATTYSTRRGRPRAAIALLGYATTPHLVKHGPAEVRQDVAVDRAPVVGHGDGRDRTDLLAPLQPPLDLPNRSRTSAAAIAPVDLLQQLGLDLLGLAVGRLGLPLDLAAEPPFTAHSFWS